MTGHSTYLNWEDLGIKKGDRVGVEIDGELFVDVVKDIVEDRETVRIVVG